MGVCKSQIIKYGVIKCHGSPSHAVAYIATGVTLSCSKPDDWPCRVSSGSVSMHRLYIPYDPW